jgi:hypothetical protein
VLSHPMPMSPRSAQMSCRLTGWRDRTFHQQPLCQAASKAQLGRHPRAQSLDRATRSRAQMALLPAESMSIMQAGQCPAGITGSFTALALSSFSRAAQQNKPGVCLPSDSPQCGCTEPANPVLK